MPPLPLSGATAGLPFARLEGVGQWLRAAWRGVAILAWTGPSALLQTLLLLLPGRGKVVFARLYWAGMCRIMGLQVRMLGTVPDARAVGAAPILFASNHSSWLDIMALGGQLEGCFVAKEEVGHWPVVRTIARLGRTVFVSRRASGTGRERDGMRARLEAGDNLILFPEGTSSDGSRVLPFRSAFFSVVEGGEGRQPVIQPVSIVYDRLAGLPTGRTTRPILAWYGDMALGPHVWRLARYRGLRATIVLHPPLDPASFASRKELARAVWTTVDGTAALLRQNRPATLA